jgi:hypothetical protein
VLQWAVRKVECSFAYSVCLRYVNDVCEQILNCKFHLYADDLQLYKFWCMVLNVSKTHAMFISRRNRGVVVEHPLFVSEDVVVFSDSVKNLGLYIDNRLSWREQVSRIVSLRLLYRF